MASRKNLCNIVNGRIKCGMCEKSYKLNRNGTPSAYLIKHLINWHGLTQQECYTIINDSINSVKEYEEEEHEENNDDECVICCDYFTHSNRKCNIPCKHNNFHLSCLKQMNNDNCPLCRAKMNINVHVRRQRSPNLGNEEYARWLHNHEILSEPFAEQIVNNMEQNDETIEQIQDDIIEQPDIHIQPENLHNRTNNIFSIIATFLRRQFA